MGILDSVTNAVKNTFSDKTSVVGGLWELAKTGGGRVADTVTGISILSSELGQSKYNFNYLAFPSDLNQNYQGHYVVFNINVPVDRGGEPRGAFAPISNVLSTEYSKVDTLRFGPNPFPNARQAEAFSIPRYTRRIEQSVALFMPQSLMYTHQHDFSEISLTAIAGEVGVGALQGVNSLLGPLGEAANKLLDVFQGTVGTATKVMGYPINPRTEILYQNTRLRQFSFDFLMFPRNEYEAETIENIITAFKFYSSPELDNNKATMGMTFIPPAEFDITFFNKGGENLHLPRINTCVLHRVDVNYSPLGDKYSTFSTGHPIAVMLQLVFVEVEILHKMRVLEGL